MAPASRFSCCSYKCARESWGETPDGIRPEGIIKPTKWAPQIQQVATGRKTPPINVEIRLHSYPVERRVFGAVGILVTQVVIWLYALVGHVTQCRPLPVRVRPAASSWAGKVGGTQIYAWYFFYSIPQLERETRTDCKVDGSEPHTKQQHLTWGKDIVDIEEGTLGKVCIFRTIA